VDYQLLKNIKSGHPGSQKEFYYLYADHLMLIISRYIKQQIDREEILHDVFLKIFDNISTFDPNKGSFKSWISRIAINHSINFLKKRHTLYINIEDVNYIKSIYNDGMESLKMEDLNKLVETLDAKYKTVFKLKVYDGLEYKEISDLLGSSQSNIRKIFSRSRLMLQSIFSQSTNPVNSNSQISKHF